MGGQAPYLSFLGVCSLTAGTLVVTGFVGELTADRGSRSPGKERDSMRSRKRPTDSLTLIGQRILSVGLPFFAASKLGGARVAIVMAAALAAGLGSMGMAPDGRSSRAFMKSLLSQKWIAGILLLQIMLDVTGLSGTYLPLQAASGYLSLLVSILVLPPPYPKLREGGSETGGTTASVLVGGNEPRSPMIATAKDTDSTIASSVLPPGASFVAFTSSPRETQNLTLPLLAGGSIVAVMFAASLLVAEPTSLKSQHKIGLAIGLTLSLIIQELIDPLPAPLVISQVVLAFFSWGGIYLDTHSQQSHTQHSHHNHNHDHSMHSHGAHSRVTGFLLSASEGFPLLHSILLEKDSRRILYFMWCVMPDFWSAFY